MLHKVYVFIRCEVVAMEGVAVSYEMVAMDMAYESQRRMLLPE